RRRSFSPSSSRLRRTLPTSNCVLRLSARYRDFEGHDNQYEGPYDFHSEEQLP
ncbi:unnamed protein product, partial [Ectocarpus sp. 12 AP-2014]